MEIVLKDINDLAPYENNPRNNQNAIKAVAESIKQFGWKVPVVIDKNNVIVAGHTRVSSARLLGYDQIPCIIADDLTDEQVRAFRLADNKTAELAEWDDEKLNLELAKLSDFDMSAFGFEELDDSTKVEESDDDPEAMAAAIEEPTTQLDDIYQLGRHRLVCGDSTDKAVLEKLMDGEQADLLLTDPPYNVALGQDGGHALRPLEAKQLHRRTDGLTIDNDSWKTDEEFIDFLVKAFKAALGEIRAGAAFYIWYADTQALNFRRAAERAGLQISQNLIWVKSNFALGRQDYQWQHEPCQPAGTMVRTPDGEKPIEALKDGDEVISWDSYSGAVKGYKNGGYKVQTASREYHGELYGIAANGHATWATDNHEFSVRFNPNTRKNYCTYLMQKGKRWRVGIAKAYDARQFGLKTRYHQEKAENMWLISMHADKAEAQVMEQILTVKYGIPYTVWELDRYNRGQRTSEQIEAIYNALDLDKMREGALRLLHDFHRSEKYPLITRENKAERFSTRVTARINACNIVPELMQVPVPAKANETPNFKWADISEIKHKQHDGLVYSLAVEKYQHYISDGIITHNCLYGWKDGAGHYFTDSRTEATVFEDRVNINKLSKEEMKALLKELLADKQSTTVIHEDKPSKSVEHPTMKPLKLLARQIKNSTRRGEKVLDTFGGSGSTLLACEQLGRTCYTAELDPKYCDVIVQRWENATGGKAVRISGSSE